MSVRTGIGDPATSTTETTDPEVPNVVKPPRRFGRGIPQLCHRLAEARSFQLTSTVVIVFNAVLIGVETYSSIVAKIGPLLHFLDELCLTFFIVELVIRLTAHGRTPWRFFRSGWNCFDFLVVAAGLLPGLRENVTLLRLIRLARIVRLIRVFPSLRILLTAVGRSLPGALGLFVVGVVVLYLYGVLGWILFGKAQPEEFGTIGSAVLTLFFLLTMDSVGLTVREGIEITALALPYYISFILFGAFVLINLLIGVVITSMEEARQIEGDSKTAKTPEVEDPPPDTREILAKIAELQAMVERMSPPTDRASPPGDSGASKNQV